MADEVPAPPPSRRITRSSARQQQQRGTERRKIQADFQNLLENPQTTGPALKAFIDAAPKSISQWLKSEDWDPAVLRWIDAKNLEAFYYYAALKLSHDTYDHFYSMDAFLNAMLASGQTEILRNSERVFWKNMRQWLLRTRPFAWWNSHLRTTLKALPAHPENWAYIRGLIQRDYIIPIQVVLDNADALDLSKLQYLAKALVFQVRSHPELDNIYTFWIASPNHYQVLAHALAGIKYSENRDAFLAAILHATFKASPSSALEPISPLLFELPIPSNTQSQQVYAKIEDQGWKAPLDFLLRNAIKHGYTQYTAMLLKHLDMKREENKAWLSYAFYLYIVYNHWDLEPLLKTLLQYPAYHLNINNVYITINPEIENMNENLSVLMMNRILGLANLDEIQNAAAHHPLAQPSSWIKELPLLAVAILYKNKRAIKFFVSQGATFNRCALTLADLTTDNEILKLFQAKTHITRTQRKYRTHYYHPGHPSQATRQAKWEADTAA